MGSFPSEEKEVNVQFPEAQTAAESKKSGINRRTKPSIVVEYTNCGVGRCGLVNVDVDGRSARRQICSGSPRRSRTLQNVISAGTPRNFTTMPFVPTKLPEQKYHKLVHLDRDDVKVKQEVLDDEPVKAEDLTDEDIALQEAQREAYEFEHGPFSLLHHAFREKSQLVVWMRNDHKLLAGIKAFDRHGNMVLTKVKEIWYEVSKRKKGKKKRHIERSKFMHLVFLRGDNVITVVNHSNQEISPGEVQKSS